MDIEVGAKKEEIAENTTPDFSAENTIEKNESATGNSSEADTVETAPANADTADTTPMDADTAGTAPTDADTAEATPIDADSAEIAPADADSAQAAPVDADTAGTAPADADSARAASADADSAETTSPAEPSPKKNVDKKRMIRGTLELAATALILAFSVYLFYNTRGTRLLFVDVAFGRICRYYWIGLLAAIILGLMGLLTLKRHPRTTAKTDMKEGK